MHLRAYQNIGNTLLKKKSVRRLLSVGVMYVRRLQPLARPAQRLDLVRHHLLELPFGDAVAVKDNTRGLDPYARINQTKQYQKCTNEICLYFLCALFVELACGGVS